MVHAEGADFLDSRVEVLGVSLTMKNLFKQARNFYRSTKALHLSWYIYWYRWTLKSLVNSFRGIDDEKGKPLASEAGGSGSPDLG